MGDEIYYDNIIVGAGPAGLQLSYFFKKNNINYLQIEKTDVCGSFFNKFPHGSQLISINKKNTGSDNLDFNLRHDWNSLLNDEDHLFNNYTDKFYPDSKLLFQYFNDFYKKNDLNILFNTSVLSINKIDNIVDDKEKVKSSLNLNDYNYKLNIENSDKKYYCKKLIIATGLSIANYPKFKLNVERPILHYKDFESGFFQDKEKLKMYENKRVLIVGGGNSSYELANILNEYTSSILLMGSLKDMSIVSHYAGDIRSIYYTFLDTFFLKSLNAIDILDNKYREELSINEITDKENKNFKKYEIKINKKLMYPNDKINYFDEVIFCTGWKFNNTIFNFNVDLTPNFKYPLINSNYESKNNKDLFFIGSLMHSLDFKRSSGGFIHGFRYLIKFFTEINYNLGHEINYFKFDGTLKCYTELANYIMKRINTSSSLYQMFGVMSDVFYYDNKNKQIVYINNITLQYARELYCDKLSLSNFIALQLNYGEKQYDIRKIGGFNKYNPMFLHPEIMIFEKNNIDNYELIDKIMIEEDLFADFTSNNHFKKILKTLKGCPLII
jgi:thioredoxin reductase